MTFAVYITTSDTYLHMVCIRFDRLGVVVSADLSNLRGTW